MSDQNSIKMLVFLIILFSLSTAFQTLGYTVYLDQIQNINANNTYKLIINGPDIVPVNTTTGFQIILYNNSEIVRTHTTILLSDKIIDISYSISSIIVQDLISNKTEYLENENIIKYDEFYVIKISFSRESLYLLNVTVNITVNETNTTSGEQNITSVKVRAYRVMQTVDIISRIREIMDDIKYNISSKIDEAVETLMDNISSVEELLNAIIGNRTNYISLAELMKRINYILGNLSNVGNLLNNTNKKLIAINNTLSDIKDLLDNTSFSLNNISTRIGFLRIGGKDYTLFEYLLELDHNITSINNTVLVTLINNLVNLSSYLTNIERDYLKTILGNLTDPENNISSIVLFRLKLVEDKVLGRLGKLENNLKKSINEIVGTSETRIKESIENSTSEIIGTLDDLNTSIYDSLYNVNNSVHSHINSLWEDLSILLDSIENNINNNIDNVSNKLDHAIALVRYDIATNISYLELMLINKSTNIWNLLHMIYGNVSLSDIKADLAILESNSSYVILKINHIINDITSLRNLINTTRDYLLTTITTQLSNISQDLRELIQDSNKTVINTIEYSSNNIYNKLDPRLNSLEGEQGFLNIIIGLLTGSIFALIIVLFKKII